MRKDKSRPPVIDNAPLRFLAEGARALEIAPSPERAKEEQVSSQAQWQVPEERAKRMDKGKWIAGPPRTIRAWLARPDGLWHLGSVQRLLPCLVRSYEGLLHEEERDV